MLFNQLHVQCLVCRQPPGSKLLVPLPFTQFWAPVCPHTINTSSLSLCHTRDYIPGSPHFLYCKLKGWSLKYTPYLHVVRPVTGVRPSCDRMTILLNCWWPWQNLLCVIFLYVYPTPTSAIYGVTILVTALSIVLIGVTAPWNWAEACRNKSTDPDTQHHSLLPLPGTPDHSSCIPSGPTYFPG